MRKYIIYLKLVCLKIVFLLHFSFVFGQKYNIYSSNKNNDALIINFPKNKNISLPNWKKTKEIDINFVPKQIAKTRTGNLYVSDTKGNVFFFDMQNLDNLDKKVERKIIYTPEKIAQITQIDAWQTQEIMLFYMDYQEFYLLDRFLKPISKPRFKLL